MKALDQAIERMSALSSDEMGHLHGGFASGDTELVDADVARSVEVTVAGNGTSMCGCGCRS